MPVGSRLPNYRRLVMTVGEFIDRMHLTAESDFRVYGWGSWGDAGGPAYDPDDPPTVNLFSPYRFETSWEAWGIANHFGRGPTVGTGDGFEWVWLAGQRAKDETEQAAIQAASLDRCGPTIYPSGTVIILSSPTKPDPYSTWSAPRTTCIGSGTVTSHVLHHDTNPGIAHSFTVEEPNVLLIAFVASNQTANSGDPVSNVRWQPKDDPPNSATPEEFTRIAQRIADVDGREHTIWALWNPSLSVLNSSVSFSNSDNGLRASFGVVAVTGFTADPSPSIITGLSDGSGVAAGVTFNAGSRALVISHGVVFSTSTSITATGAGMVELQENAASGVGPTTAELDYQENVSGSVTASWTLGNGGSGWHAAAVSIPSG